ncbi:MAG: hypothetical protein LBG62_06115 [Candidatus Methanoplasma sp.]|jgi:hypothetical protein|nr:hypothetical protein [Candidatus Methanoplasma sp.]
MIFEEILVTPFDPWADKPETPYYDPAFAERMALSFEAKYYDEDGNETKPLTAAEFLKKYPPLYKD